MKKLFLSGIIVAVLASMLFTSCYKKNIEETFPSNGCDTSNVTFKNVVKPIIDTKCATSGCHMPACNYPDLTVFANVQNIALDSSLINCITRANNPMPKNLPRLDSCTINKIVSWMNHGAPNN